MNKNQQIVSEFIRLNNLDTSPEIRLLDLVSELGELSKELIKSTDYGSKQMKVSKGISNELGDTFFSLIALSNQFDLDLDIELKSTLDKYNKRIAKSGNPSSKDI